MVSNLQDDSLADAALQLVHEAAAELKEKSKAGHERYSISVPKPCDIFAVQGHKNKADTGDWVCVSPLESKFKFSDLTG